MSGSLRDPSAFFGQYKSLTLVFSSSLVGKTILAQDILDTASSDITSQVTINGNTIVLSGDLIDRVGLAKANAGDKSDPGMVISITSITEGAAQCDAGSDACASPDTCKDAFTAMASGGAESSCAPYKCVAGNGQQQCTSDEDCAQDYLCVNSACKPINVDAGISTVEDGGSVGDARKADTGPEPTAAAADAGCACRVDGRLASGGPPAGVVLLLGLLSLARRRQHRTHVDDD